ncbi:MAG: response regulator transcription factor [Chloroflexi bacterium]|nr:MAG: response regulator transcription factor [Chloroflexota bacterium]
MTLDKDVLQLEVLASLLKHEGHRVHPTADPEAALAILHSSLVDLVIIEPATQRPDGIRLCQQIRQLNPYRPLMIVSERGDEEQIFKTMMVAADDYMVKPLSPRLFVAHVHALLRRAEQVRGQRWQDQNVAIGEISLSLQQMHAVVNGQRVPLTPRELSLLHALMENANRVLNRDQLMRIAWGDHFVGTPKAVDVYVQRLRRKIQPHLTAGFYIQSLRGFGYKFEIPRPQPVAV